MYFFLSSFRFLSKDIGIVDEQRKQELPQRDNTTSMPLECAVSLIRFESKGIHQLAVIIIVTSSSSSFTLLQRIKTIYCPFTSSHSLYIEIIYHYYCLVSPSKLCFIVIDIGVTHSTPIPLPASSHPVRHPRGNRRLHSICNNNNSLEIIIGYGVCVCVLSRDRMVIIIIHTFSTVQVLK